MLRFSKKQAVAYRAEPWSQYYVTTSAGVFRITTDRTLVSRDHGPAFGGFVGKLLGKFVSLFRHE